MDETCRFAFLYESPLQRQQSDTLSIVFLGLGRALVPYEVSEFFSDFVMDQRVPSVSSERPALLDLKFRGHCTLGKVSSMTIPCSLRATFPKLHCRASGEPPYSDYPFRGSRYGQHRYVLYRDCLLYTVPHSSQCLHERQNQMSQITALELREC